MPGNDPNDAFLQRLRSTFRVEAEEHVQAISSALLSLERDPGSGDAAPLETAFRHFHSLKGAARAVNLFQIEKLCQASESLLALWKTPGDAAPDQDSFDALHAAISAISKAVPDEKGNVTVISAEQMNALLAPLGQRKTATAKPQEQPPELQTPAPPTRVQPAPSAASDLTGELPLLRSSVRVPTEKLDALLTQSEELLAVKMRWAAREGELKAMGETLQRWENQWSKVRPLASFAEKDVPDAQRQHTNPAGRPAATIAALPEQPIWDFLEWNANFVRAVQEKLRSLTEATGKDAQSAGRLVDDLVSVSKQLLMLPFSTVADVIPKIVRDLSRDQGKQVELVLLGADMEMDKRILEELKDPLIHLVRNCVGHGIEPPEARAQSGKPPRGKITVEAVRTSNNTAEITVSDDGSGINTENLKAAALQRGLISAEEAEKMSATDAQSLIFRPGLSTTSAVTEISGRGMGLSVVQQAIQKLGGRIAVESGEQTGTTFRMTLPLIFGTVNGLLVRAADHIFIFPTAHIDRVIRINKGEIKVIQERDWLTVESKTVPYAHLATLLDLKKTRQNDESEKQTVLVASHANETVAFGVEEVLSVEEVLVKPLKKPLIRVCNILGATTLASGKIVPILNVHDLTRAVKQAKAAPPPVAPKTQEEQKPQRQQKILLAEDSMTSRMLLKGILETAGYVVQTAVDGIEALTLLKTEHFDLIISDVEMPRMNGFDLITEIRKDRRLSEKPVVLVTALATREDRERGIDVGANAYIVKSSFEQSNLLDTVRRLI